MQHSAHKKTRSAEEMGNSRKGIAWAGCIYGAISSLYLLVWYVSAFQHARRSSLSPLLWPKELILIALFLHFIIGLISVQSGPREWVPVGPPSQKFRIGAEWAIYFALGLTLVLVPALIKAKSLYSENILSSVLLVQTTYIFAHFAVGYSIIGKRALQEEKIRTVLRGMRGEDVAQICRDHRITAQVYRRWRSEVEASDLREVVSKLVQKKEEVGKKGTA